jgi:PilZ domain
MQVGVGRPIRERVEVEVHNPSGTGQSQRAVDARRHPRYKLEVDICVYPRECPVVRGNTVDISESGISALLRDELPLGEVVRLSFTLPLGEVEVHALVRQRNAFRYGFQFVETSSAQDVIGQTCRELSVTQVLDPPMPR